MRHDVLGVLRSAEDALDHNVGKEPETLSVLGAGGHTAKNHAPHKLLIQTLACVVCENQTPVAEAISLWAILWRIARDCRCDGIKILPLLTCEVEVRENDAILEKRNA